MMDFDDWWEKESGNSLTGHQLAQRAWNAAIDAARVECYKSAPRPTIELPNAIGARDCIEIREALLTLFKT